MPAEALRDRLEGEVAEEPGVGVPKVCTSPRKVEGEGTIELSRPGLVGACDAGLALLRALCNFL